MMLGSKSSSKKEPDCTGTGMHDVKRALVLANVARKLQTYLKECEPELATNQEKLQNVIERQWHMKGTLKALMNYYEMTNQLALEPDQWITQEELDRKSSEILAELVKEKSKFKGLTKKGENDEVFGNMLALLEQEQNILYGLDKIQKKEELLKELQMHGSGCSKDFQSLCSTRDQAKIMIEKKREALMEKKRAIAMLQHEMEINAIATDTRPREMASLKDIEYILSVALPIIENSELEYNALVMAWYLGV